jgi:phage terminase small subunit
MGGRNGKPVDLHLAEGNRSHLTKAQIEARQAAEIKLGADEWKKIKPPPNVKNDAAAYRWWKDLVKDYKSAAEQGVELLTSSDIGLLAIYCKTYAEYEDLQVQRRMLIRIQEDPEIFDEALEHNGLIFAEVKAIQYLRQLASIEGMLKLDGAINKKMDMLIKMQDRLFLNPLAKVKNIPKPAPKDEKPSKFGRFGGGRSG